MPSAALELGFLRLLWALTHRAPSVSICSVQTPSILRDISIAFATAAVVAIGFWMTSPVESQAARPARIAGKPNLNGIWQAINTANYDILSHQAKAALAMRPGPVVPIPAAPVLALGAVGAVPAGIGIVEGDELPYLPEAAKKQKENQENWLDRDPELKCYLPGIPRATYMPYPFQIVQGTNKVQMAYTFANAARTIHLDKVDEPPDLSYMGHSLGRWEGDTLVVDVTQFNGKNWLDRAGNFHGEGLHLVERFTPMSADAINYEVTIEDAEVFTQPWKIAMPLYRRLEPQSQLIEYPCIDFSEEFMYGHVRKEPLVKHWEGETLIVDITRKVPAGDKFHEWYRR